MSIERFSRVCLLLVCLAFAFPRIAAADGVVHVVMPSTLTDYEGRCAANKATLEEAIAMAAPDDIILMSSTDVDGAPRDWDFNLKYTFSTDDDQSIFVTKPLTIKGEVDIGGAPKTRVMMGDVNILTEAGVLFYPNGADVNFRNLYFEATLVPYNGGQVNYAQPLYCIDGLFEVSSCVFKRVEGPIFQTKDTQAYPNLLADPLNPFGVIRQNVLRDCTFIETHRMVYGLGGSYLIHNNEMSGKPKWGYAQGGTGYISLNPGYGPDYQYCVGAQVFDNTFDFTGVDWSVADIFDEASWTLVKSPVCNAIRLMTLGLGFYGQHGSMQDLQVFDNEFINVKCVIPSQENAPPTFNHLNNGVIALIGNSDGLYKDVRITNNTFRGCDSPTMITMGASGVGANLSEARVAQNTFEGTLVNGVYTDPRPTYPVLWYRGGGANSSGVSNVFSLHNKMTNSGKTDVCWRASEQVPGLGKINHIKSLEMYPPNNDVGQISQYVSTQYVSAVLLDQAAPYYNSFRYVGAGRGVADAAAQDEEVEIGLGQRHGWRGHGQGGNSSLTRGPDESSADINRTPPRATLFAPPYPNPCRGATQLDYEIAGAGPVRLDIYDVSGRLVRRLRNEPQAHGHYRVIWDGRDQRGGNATAGVYFAVLHATGAMNSQKIILIR